MFSRSFAVLVTVATLLSGCAGQTSPSVGLVAFETVTTKEMVTPRGKTIDRAYSMGSGAQWNADYVVTARHVLLDASQGRAEFECNTGCDLKFVQRAATSGIPSWRERTRGESLAAVGYTIKPDATDPGRVTRRKVVANGFDADIATRTTVDGNNWLMLARMDTVNGMSGGPLYGADGNIVGILTGSTMLKRESGFYYDADGNQVAPAPQSADAVTEGKLLAYAVYIPYSMIHEQWQRFASSSPSTLTASVERN